MFTSTNNLYIKIQVGLALASSFKSACTQQLSEITP